MIKITEYHKGFGTACYTPILLVVYPKKYPVINSIVKDALQRMGIYPDYDSKPEWLAYSEVYPKILELANKNNLSLWQIDSMWWDISAISDFDGLYNFITKIMGTKTMHQPIIIRTLLETDVAFEETINEKIRLEYAGKEDNFVLPKIYEELIEKHKILKLDINGYKLNLVNPLRRKELN